MGSRPKYDEALVRRMLPSANADQADRAHAWAEWQLNGGRTSLLKFIRINNHTSEPDEDIFQDALLTAYLEVERGRYQVQPGVPFTAYVKGIARKKIREARRGERNNVTLEDISCQPSNILRWQPEISIERHELNQVLSHGLSMLPEHRRQVLERYMRGKSTREIATELAMSEALVHQHKSRGLRRLRQMGVFDLSRSV